MSAQPRSHPEWSLDKEYRVKGRAQLCLCPGMRLELPLSPPGTSSAIRWAPSSILKAWNVQGLLPGERGERSALVFAIEDILPAPHSAGA